MKGLMVSLIIVFFAGTTSSVLAVGQQAEQDAAKFKPRLSLQPIAASLERPGPDDSDDDVAWPTRPSLLSKESTTTSSFGDRQRGAPTPESVLDKNIRFDVKVDENAIALLKQGRKVFSPVEVKDETTNAALHPKVVSDIALFMGSNAGKDLQGVRLEPQEMEPGSTTLKFEIPTQDLDRIERDAFLFNVPDNLRGKFNRVEFVAVGPTGSHEFSGGLTTGTRGSGLGFGSPDGTSRFSTDPANRFSGASETSRWNTETPLPGPGFAPGEPEFTGPYIDQDVLEERRNRVAPLDTGNRFGLAKREPAVEPKRSPFGRTWEEPEVVQNPRNQSTISQPNIGQRNQESLAEQATASCSAAVGRRQG